MTHRVSIIACVTILAVIQLIHGADMLTEQNKQDEKTKTEHKTATFGNGCFWCTEAVFQRLNGVKSVVSGYMGGQTKNPTYKDICTGNTGHAEVIQITYDPKTISYPELLEVFWKTHDPTTLNRQGNDVGTQYRSVIFYHDSEQQKAAQEYKSKLDKAGIYSKPIVTEITSASSFYPAEDYHQNYFNLNGKQPYCSYVIQPKLDKFKEVFKDKLKKE
ncbi:MAG: peptide-methionine (S)-S-oxide reductase MsrA [Planctomycetia bacterium]|nr:peptide-methionine (S)-S-oxide reductase MsrA [Planctomycetia bacterium]